MSPDPIQLLLVNLKHLNHGLFSDYYLEERLPKQQDWLPLQNEARAVRSALKAELDRIGEAQLARMDEAQLEAQWVQPTLKRLGHHFSVQVKLRFGEHGYRKPDYALVRTDQDASSLTAQIYTPAELKHALAVGDAKKWGISLDQSAAKGERNPSQQIDEYLRYSELPWGILTDGRYWRLYEKESSKNNLYYAVDLVDLLNRESIDDFIYFYAFFRQAAFTDGWLNAVLASSSDYAEKLSDTLENQVYEALELIAQGFLDYRRNQLEPTPEMLRTIYEQSLVLLYRLLFILYAESREILPIRQNDGYAKRLSLDALKKAIANANLAALDPDDSSYYAKLKDLFFGIDAGNPRYDLPAYNGRLFSATEHPFLDSKIIGDKHLAPAIDKMARVADEEQGGKLVMVDYRDLEVRHLGAIYEKLLEYQLEIASEALTVKEDEYVPAKAGDKVIKRVGEVILRTGNNKRKVTGSYYTPDYIVRFIVERTLEPLLTEITQRYATRQEDGSWLVRDGDSLRDAILDLNILDPATGSGHFMVDAAAYIAEWLRSLALAPADLIASNEDELIYWKRQVVSACIYGVDINPLAVELAKLSLWLATLAQGKPLSFLDHHLKCGNSLVGTRMQDIGAELVDQKAEKRRKAKQAAEAAKIAATGQLTLFDLATLAPSLSFAVGQMQTIERTIAANVKQVKQQELQYAELIKRIKPWSQIADVWTARHFGLTLTPDQWQDVKQYLLNHEVKDRRAVKQVVESVEAIAQDQRFLHWELVFPEIFFASDGTQRDNGGFDAVVGNPPYVRQESIKIIKPYLETHYRSVYDGTADIYIYFYSQALRQLRVGGYLAYVTPNKWLRAGYGEPLRGYLSQAAEVRQLVDFGHSPVFKNADTFPLIVVAKKPQSKPSVDAETEITQFPRKELMRISLGEYTRSNGYRVPTQRFSAEPWSLELPEVDTLIEKLHRSGIPLKDVINSPPLYGIKTGFNEAFLIDTPTKEFLISQDKNCAEIIKPYLRGQDVKRWSPEWADEWMIVMKSSENYSWPWASAGEKAEEIFAKTYPSIFTRFKVFEKQLRNRGDQGRYWWEFRSCTYYSSFEVPKILYQTIQFHPAYSYDSDGYITNNKCFIVPSIPIYLAAILNSPLMWWHNWRYFGHMKDETLDPVREKLIQVPVAVPSDKIQVHLGLAVPSVIALTKDRRSKLGESLDWLRVEFGIDKPGQKLEAFTELDLDAFIDEVRDRRPKKSVRLTPAAVAALKQTYSEYVPIIQRIDAQMIQHERRISDLVNEAYGLTAEEIDLMWGTAPPRMPLTSGK